VVTFVRVAALRSGQKDGGVMTVHSSNLFDEEYYHPGVRGANSGTTPGFFDETGRWRGSVGFYNSLLPQSGRAYQIMLHVGR
jgi:hypothetical protein